MIYEQKVEVNLTSSNMRHFKEKGYDCPHKNMKIMVDVHDLPPTSRVKVKFKCDFCGKDFERSYFDANRSGSGKHTCGDQECKKKLRAETNMRRYGVTNTAYSKELMDKAAKKFVKNYGVGSPNHEDYVKRRNQTNIERYGSEMGFMHEDSHSKRLKTMFETFDEAECRKGVRKATSKEQARLCELLDGILNYPVDGNRFYIDIALEEEKIAVEYNGNGHQIFRSKDDDVNSDLQLHSYGWDIVRIVASKKKITKKRLFDVIDFSRKLFRSNNNIYTLSYRVDNEILEFDNKTVSWNEVVFEDD